MLQRVDHSKGTRLPMSAKSLPNAFVGRQGLPQTSDRSEGDPGFHKTRSHSRISTAAQASLSVSIFAKHVIFLVVRVDASQTSSLLLSAFRSTRTMTELLQFDAMLW